MLGVAPISILPVGNIPNVIPNLINPNMINLNNTNGIPTVQYSFN